MTELNSFLFVPANKQKYLYNSKISKADAIIIDFEDSVIQEHILENVININKTFDDILLKNIYLRISPENYMDILQKIKLDKIKGIMIPKFTLDNRNIDILKVIEKIKKEIFILIESPRGVLDLKDTLQSYKIDGVFFGSEDYISGINAVRNRENMLFPRMNIINISKAFGVSCYDTVFPDLYSKSLFFEEVDYSYEMGFDGKLAINLSQLDYINQKFKPDTETIKKYKEIVKLFYQNMKNNKTNILVIKGKVFELPHIKRYEKKIKEFERWKK